MHSLNSWKPFSPCYRSVLSHVGDFGSRRKWIRKISFRGNVAIWNVLQVNTLRSCWGREVFFHLCTTRAKLFGSCKVLNLAAHLTTTALYVQCRPRHRSSHASSSKTIKCHLSLAKNNIPCCLLLLIVTLLSQRIPCSPFPRDANRRNHQECFNQMTLLLDSCFLKVFATTPWWAVQCTLPTRAALPSTNRLHSTLELLICTTYKGKVWFDFLWNRPSVFSSLLFPSQNFQSGFNFTEGIKFIILGMNTYFPEHPCVINYICTFSS